MKTLMSGVWKWLLERSTRRQPLRFAAVSLLTPLISASGCGWRFALSLPPPSKYIFPSHYPANAAASYQKSALLPPLQRICGHELRFWARIKMAQHFTRHYALPASVCVCVCVMCESLCHSERECVSGRWLYSLEDCALPFRFCPSRECSLFVCLTGAIQIDFVWLPSLAHTHTYSQPYRLPFCICVLLIVSMCVCAGALCFDNAPNCRPSLSRSSLHAISGLFACLPFGLSVPQGDKLGSNGLGVGLAT